ncbi:MAG: hypothetical protein A2534_02170 [Candidatus Magasanikbacteria bacterium RIFOXYD2_FULL_39_9]|uniref:PpiC domain-containing protein n=1 Tax=Candidatus Magasanikbacteria bacterium RIFOXYD1_FULL_40_23 TaxID=1798705 RepID=A0A1F6P7A6_9BACT|nr:MAG: hypothetical protein A2563_00460 [Candidatus Magasanikbacteria bacterium RIFOXYD1_FULL_40_23]OGH93506.1 MAG: hypothetical protein A2534_02170 [Candidatus Magasanikbacteria bacterium RIFOXYD2_FULL_39_9]
MEELKKVEGENKTILEKLSKFASPRTFIIVGAVAVLVIGVSALGVYRAYGKSASDKFTLTVAKALRLPAVKVGNDKVSYSTYVEDLKAIHVMRDYDKAQRESGVGPERTPGAELTEEQMTDQVLWRLVNNLLVENTAKKYEVSVDEEDVKNLKSQMLAQFKDATDLDQELKKRYGWSLDEYEHKVVRPFILQSKLSQKIKEDTAKKEPLRVEAQKVLEEVKNGADFAVLAKKYNADSTAEVGGDVGWFVKGQMVPEFEEAALSLKKGEVYPTIVETMYGYHIIRLDDRKTERVKNEEGKMESVEKARASQIFFRFADLMTYLEEMISTMKPKLYVNVHNPFADLNVESTETEK